MACEVRHVECFLISCGAAGARTALRVGGVHLAAWVPAHAAEPPSAEKIFTPSFKPYQGWRDEPLQDWREANRRVGEIGGWRTYLREAPPGGNVEVTVRKPAGHAGHH